MMCVYCIRSSFAQVERNFFVSLLLLCVYELCVCVIEFAPYSDVVSGLSVPALYVHHLFIYSIHYMVIFLNGKPEQIV